MLIYVVVSLSLGAALWVLVVRDFVFALVYVAFWIVVFGISYSVFVTWIGVFGMWDGISRILDWCI